ncbi:MAG: response regulator [Gammaproteobacteria bacterium]
MTATPNTPFLVATIGFDEREKRVLKSMFGISANRTPAFASYVFSSERPADIVLIDYDNPRALNGWKAYEKIHGKAAQVPVIAVTREPDPPAEFVVRRPIIATRLLATLESVAVQAFGLEPADAFAATSTIARARSDAASSAAPTEPAAASVDQDAPERLDLPGADVASPAANQPAPATGAGAQAKSDAGAMDPISTHATGDGTLNEPVSALVVDDSLPVRIQMKLALQGLADEVVFAETGEEAVELLSRNTYSIVFLDVILPGCDGYAICKSIKQDPRHGDTPVVMLTSNSSPADRVKGKLAGCDTYLIKPVKRAVFEEVVKDYLRTAPAA